MLLLFMLLSQKCEGYKFLKYSILEERQNSIEWQTGSKLWYLSLIKVEPKVVSAEMPFGVGLSGFESRI